MLQGYDLDVRTERLLPCPSSPEGERPECRWHDRHVELSWLIDGTVDTVRSALKLVAPELSASHIRLVPRIEQSNPLWHGGTAVLDNKFVAKFAWAEPAAERVWHEARILEALVIPSPPHSPSRGHVI
jgi:hypothetical protein